MGAVEGLGFAGGGRGWKEGGRWPPGRVPQGRLNPGDQKAVCTGRAGQVLLPGPTACTAHPRRTRGPRGSSHHSLCPPSPALAQSQQSGIRTRGGSCRSTLPPLGRKPVHSQHDTWPPPPPPSIPDPTAHPRDWVPRRERSPTSKSCIEKEP